MDAVVSHRIWNYIGMLGVGRETARDLYQEAETAIWEAVAYRQTEECHSYQVKTGVGAIRHWLRDRHLLVRIPGYLHDRHEAGNYMKTIIPFEEARETETTGYQFEDDCLDRLADEAKRQQILDLLPRLTRAERDIMERLLIRHQTPKDIAAQRKVRYKSIFNQRKRAVKKLQEMLQSAA